MIAMRLVTVFVPKSGLLKLDFKNRVKPKAACGAPCQVPRIETPIENNPANLDLDQSSTRRTDNDGADCLAAGR